MMQMRKRDVTGSLDIAEVIREDTVVDLSEEATTQVKATIADLLTSNEGLMVKQIKWKLSVVVGKI